MSKFQAYKQDLAEAKTKEDVQCIFDNIEDFWMNVLSRSENEVMTVDFYVKWNDLYDEACTKYLKFNKSFK